MSTRTTMPLGAGEKVAALREAFPKGGFFADRNWRLSPEPFPIPPRLARELETLGHRLFLFQSAANRIYLRSRKGGLPAWIAGTLDRGKPAPLVAWGADPRFRDARPRVIRPDVILGEGGFAITELDNLPGGIGVTAWLNETYTALGDTVIGGPEGMIEGFRSILPDGADLVVSAESADYRPEMEWLAARLGPGWQVATAEDYSPAGRDVYRFFELFDLANVPCADALAEAAARGNLDLTAPYKAFLEEKMWAALFWSPALREVWRRELRGSHLEKLRACLPFSWILDPTPVPHHAVFPRLEINRWDALRDFTQRERQLVLKISGFSELAWGSRGVHIGDDMAQADWAAAVDRALDDFPRNPWLLQEFRKGRLVEHPYWDEEAGALRTMRGRVRLCPYYFVPRGPDPRPKLSGILATIVPADKKVIHGMRDGILVPCRIAE